MSEDLFFVRLIVTGGKILRNRINNQEFVDIYTRGEISGQAKLSRNEKSL